VIEVNSGILMLKNKILFLFAGLFLLAGCSYPPLEDVDFPSDYTYIIGPGDGVQIFVWGNPDISISVTVRPDGKINTPLIDDLMASGKTPNKLARDIEKELSKFVRDPQVAVIVSDFQGIYSQQIRVIGQINGGGAFQHFQIFFQRAATGTPHPHLEPPEEVAVLVLMAV